MWHRYQEFLKFLKQIDKNVPVGRDVHLVWPDQGRAVRSAPFPAQPDGFRLRVTFELGKEALDVCLPRRSGRICHSSIIAINAEINCSSNYISINDLRTLLLWLLLPAAVCTVTVRCLHTRPAWWVTRKRSDLYGVISIPVPGSAHGERLAGEVLSQHPADGGYPRRVIRAGHDHAVRADGCHCPRR